MYVNWVPYIPMREGGTRAMDVVLGKFMRRGESYYDIVVHIVGAWILVVTGILAHYGQGIL